MIVPEQPRTLADVRAAIDRLDDDVVALLTPGARTSSARPGGWGPAAPRSGHPAGSSRWSSASTAP